MNKKGIASIFAAALLGSGLVWAADREKNHGIAGWETLNASMAQSLGAADEPGSAVTGRVKGTEVSKDIKVEQKKGGKADASVLGEAAGGAGVGGNSATGGDVAESTVTAGAGASGTTEIGSNPTTFGISGTSTSASGAAVTAADEANFSGSTATSPATGQSSTQGTINVNTADAAALMNLPGIGEKKAQAIIEYRSSKGAFHSLTDLGGVKGIGPKMLEKLKPLVGF
ncbi:ComEA family DNA-binding protein [Paenibacillus sp. sgz5001063]|uniref:ComEA family DNA-binding protein n=1 Tax=Paenibacillus sp. sgz5001063 TaxID=3242474 RepID=UPI0036D43253